MELKSPRFLILSEPRTGSNNVSYVLGAHPHLEVGNELLHPRNGVMPNEFSDIALDPSQPARNYHWLSAVTEVQRNQVLTQLFTRYNGFKIHSTHIPPSMTYDIVTKFDCSVIITYRHNIFDQAISNFVAIRKGKWHSDEVKNTDETIEPVRIEPRVFFNWIEQVLYHRRDLWARLAKGTGRVVLLEYDMLFYGDLAWKLQKFLKLLDILDVPRFGKLDKNQYPDVWERVLHYLDPSKQKMTDEDTANGLILNLEELRKAYHLWSMDQFRKTMYGNSDL